MAWKACACWSACWCACCASARSRRSCSTCCMVRGRGARGAGALAGVPQALGTMPLCKRQAQSTGVRATTPVPALQPAWWRQSPAASPAVRWPPPGGAGPPPDEGRGGAEHVGSRRVCVGCNTAVGCLGNGAPLSTASEALLGRHSAPHLRLGLHLGLVRHGLQAGHLLAQLQQLPQQGRGKQRQGCQRKPYGAPQAGAIQPACWAPRPTAPPYDPSQFSPPAPPWRPAQPGRRPAPPPG